MADGSKSAEDARQLNRVSCRIVVSNALRSAPLGEIQNISLDGLFIATADALPQGSVLGLAFALGDGSPEIKAEAEIVHRTPKGMGMRFLRIGQKDGRRLRRFVAEQTSIAGHRDTAARLDDVAGRVTEPIRDPARIRRLLEEGMAKNVEYTIIPGERAIRESARLRSVNGDALGFATGAHGGAAPAAERSELREDENVFVLCTIDFVSYSFQARVRSVDGSSVILRSPTAIHYSERRSSEREAGARGTFSLPVPWHEDRVLSWQLCEMSPGGLSFRAPPGEVRLLPGTPLEGATVTRNGETIRLESAVVKHLTLMGRDGPEPWLKVGVAHGVQREERSVEQVQVQGEGRPGALTRLASWGRGLTAKAAFLYHRNLGGLRHGDDARPFEVVKFPNRAGKEVVGLLNVAAREPRRMRAPLVIVLPGYGARKETLSGLALTIVHNFRHEYRDIAVLRIDNTNNLGESHKDASCTGEGRNNLHYTVTGGVDDLLGALDWARNNRHVDPTDIIVVSTSFSSIAARRALTLPETGDVSQWIAFMGAADAQNAILHVSGHIDIYGNHVRGIRSGVVTLFGCMVDAEHFCRDLAGARVATLEDARADMAKIKADVTWIVGKHDAWMDPRRVHDIMSVKAAGAREVIEVDTGHVPRSSDEALTQFGLITRRLWRHLYSRDLQPRRPSEGWIGAVSAREWERVARTQLDRPTDYWRDYLLGDDGIGFDVLNYSPGYQGLVALLVELAAPAGKRVLDLGAGTGNVTCALAGARPREIISVDLVAEALAKLQAKTEGLPVRTVVADADGSAWTAMRRWLDGELPGLASLAGRIPGVGQPLLEYLGASYDPTMHALLRGLAVEPEAAARVARVPPQHAAALADLHLLARAVSGREAPETVGPRMQRIHPDAVFSRRGLPFPDGAFDAVVSNLVLSYMRYPEDTLSEIYRVLAPGGTLVISSMKRDTDSSKLFLDLISDLESRDASSLAEDKDALIRSARSLVNSAAVLLRLEEEGTFRFFDGDELAALARGAGFEDTRITASFGVPPQAVVVSCRKV